MGVSNLQPHLELHMLTKGSDQGKGYILYHGYTVDQLQSCEYEDLLHLMIWGSLPNENQRETLRLTLAEAMCHIPPSVVDTVQSFPRSSHPMPLLAAGLSAYMAADPYSIPTLVGKTLYHGNATQTDASIIATTAAYAVAFGLACSHLSGKEFTPPSAHEYFYHNFLTMAGNVDTDTGHPLPSILRALREWAPVILDHGQTNSTFAMAVTASSLTHPIAALTSSMLSGYGELHFGAQETAYRTLEKIGSRENVSAYLDRVKIGKERIHGFGHRSYKTVDVRVPYGLKLLEQLGEERAPLLGVAKELHRAVVTDEFFKKKGLNPNVDIYGQLVYVAM